MKRGARFGVGLTLVGLVVGGLVISETRGSCGEWGRFLYFEEDAEDRNKPQDGQRLAYVIGHEGHYPYRIVVGRADASNPDRVPGTPEQEQATLQIEDWATC